MFQTDIFCKIHVECCACRFSNVNIHIILFLPFFDFLLINILTFFAEKSVLNTNFFWKKLTKSARIFWFSQWFYRFNLFVIVAVRLSLKNREAFHWILWLNSTSLWCREHHFSDFVAQSFQVDWFFLSILHFLQSALKLVRQEFNCSLFDIWL